MASLFTWNSRRKNQSSVNGWYFYDPSSTPHTSWHWQWGCLLAMGLTLSLIPDSGLLSTAKWFELKLNRPAWHRSTRTVRPVKEQWRWCWSSSAEDEEWVKCDMAISRVLHFRPPEFKVKDLHRWTRSWCCWWSINLAVDIDLYL